MKVIPPRLSLAGMYRSITSNTGEPGRDGGCNIVNLGTTAIVAGTQNLTVTNLAKIKSTKVEFDPESNGYIVTLGFDLAG